MARFFFNLRDDMSVDDEEGVELPDVEAARARAEAYALDMSAASVLEQGRIDLHHRIEVTDEAGRNVLTVEFGDVVTVES
jgi:hypothetical protein